RCHQSQPRGGGGARTISRRSLSPPQRDGHPGASLARAALGDSPPGPEFLDLLAAGMARRPPQLSAGALAMLAAHPWPGNVRELRATLERAVVLCDGPEIREEHLLLRPSGL